MLIDEIVIEDMKSMKEKRHECYENKDRYDMMAISKPFKDVPPVERRFHDDDEIYDRILDWNQDNKSLAKKEEWEQFRDFDVTIRELKDKDSNYFWPQRGLLRGARYRSNLSINGSSTSSMMGSNSNLASAEKTPSVIGSSKHLFLKSLKQQSSVGSKGRAAAKKTVYMPAGAERDLMEFLSIKE